MPIDFNDKLRSTRRDHKLIDASAIDGEIPAANLPDSSGTDFTWRPAFYVLGKSGAALNENKTLKIGTLQNGEPVSRATYHPPSGIDDDVRGWPFTTHRLVVDVVRVTNAGREVELAGESFGFDRVPDLAEDEKLYCVWARMPATLPALSAGETADYDISPAVVELGGGFTTEVVHGAPADRHVIEPLEPLAGDDLSIGDVVLSGNAFHRFATPGAPNQFRGVLGTYREQQTYYLVTSRSDSQFGAHGRFLDNHGGAIGAVLVGASTNNIMEVHLDKGAYETAKGSAVAAGDQIDAFFGGVISGANVATTHNLTYARTFSVHGRSWLSFEGQAPNSVPKRVGTDAGGWSLIVSQGGSVLLSHGVDASHFAEYPVAGIDATARAAVDTLSQPANLRDALQTLMGDARLDASAIKDLPQPVAGLAGLRTESISFQEDVAESPSDELSPLAQDPIAVVHGDGDPEMLTGITGNDFTVQPGLYFIQAAGNKDGSGIGNFKLQFRQSSDDAVIAALPNIFLLQHRGAALHGVGILARHPGRRGEPFPGPLRQPRGRRRRPGGLLRPADGRGHRRPPRDRAAGASGHGRGERRRGGSLRSRVLRAPAGARDGQHVRGRVGALDRRGGHLARHRDTEQRLRAARRVLVQPGLERRRAACRGVNLQRQHHRCLDTQGRLRRRPRQVRARRRHGEGRYYR